MSLMTDFKFALRSLTRASGLALTVIVTLVVFAVETLSQEPATALAIVVFLVLSVGADFFWRHIPFLRGTDATTTVSPGLTPVSDR